MERNTNRKADTMRIEKLEIGRTYKINGRYYEAIEKRDLSDLPALAKYIDDCTTVRGRRGAVKQIERRLNGTGFAIGITGGLTDEIVTFEAC